MILAKGSHSNCACSCNVFAILQQPIALVFLLLSLAGFCAPFTAKAIGAYRDSQSDLPGGNDE